CRQKLNFNFSTKQLTEVGICVALGAGIFFLLQVEELHMTLQRSLPFLALPFLLWLAFRFDLLVAVSGVLAASLAAILVTVKGSGPFNLPNPSDTVLLLQIYIGVIGISTIILSATVRERLDVQNKLLLFNENLESMVQERTA